MHVERRGRVVTVRQLACCLGVLACALTASLALADRADAHQSGCHRWHSCPSDLRHVRLARLCVGKGVRLASGLVRLHLASRDALSQRRVGNGSSALLGWDLLLVHKASMRKLVAASLVTLAALGAYGASAKAAGIAPIRSVSATRGANDRPHRTTAYAVGAPSAWTGRRSRQFWTATRRLSAVGLDQLVCRPGSEHIESHPPIHHRSVGKWHSHYRDPVCRGRGR